jgi:hypothetical protein
VRRKVIETIKNSVVWTMSDSGYVEKQTPSKGKSPLGRRRRPGRPNNSQSAPHPGGLWEEWKVERKVYTTIENNQV